MGRSIALNIEDMKRTKKKTVDTNAVDTNAVDTNAVDKQSKKRYFLAARQYSRKPIVMRLHSGRRVCYSDKFIEVTETDAIAARRRLADFWLIESDNGIPVIPFQK